jgi:hypothetical protein
VTRRARIIIALLTGLAATTPLASAQAGARTTVAVYVDTVGRYAQGQFGSARNDAGTTSAVYASFNASIGYRTVSLSFYDATGRYGSCYSSAPEIIDAVAALNSDSLVWAQWNTSGQCTSVGAILGSSYAPKAP